MILVTDTNRIIAALIKDSLSRKIIYSDKFILLAPSFAKTEVENNKREILEKTNLPETTFDSLFALILNNIYIVDDSILRYKFDDAKKIMDKVDPSDTAFVALALAIKNDGIWSDDRDFQRQKEIKVWRTENLIRYL